MDLILNILIIGLLCLGIYSIIKKKTALRFVSFSLMLLFVIFAKPITQVLSHSLDSTLMNSVPLGRQVMEGELGFIKANDTIYNSYDYYHKIKSSAFDIYILKDHNSYIQNIYADSSITKVLRNYNYDSLLNIHKTVFLKIDCNVKSSDVCIGLKIEDIKLLNGTPKVEIR